MSKTGQQPAAGQPHPARVQANLDRGGASLAKPGGVAATRGILAGVLFCSAALGACAAPVADAPEALDSHSDELWALDSSQLWPTRQVPVCFQELANVGSLEAGPACDTSPSSEACATEIRNTQSYIVPTNMGSPVFRAFEAQIRELIETELEGLPGTALDFTGWGNCRNSVTGTMPGTLRIRVLVDSGKKRGHEGTFCREGSKMADECERNSDCWSRADLELEEKDRPKCLGSYVGVDHSSVWAAGQCTVDPSELGLGTCWVGAYSPDWETNIWISTSTYSDPAALARSPYVLTDNERVVVLHEVLHALGFGHEFDRTDETCWGGAVDTSGDRILLTTLDPLSNSGATYCENWKQGLSPKDRLGLEIAYHDGSRRAIAIPGAYRVDGALVANRSDVTVMTGWSARGAHPDVFDDGVDWRITRPDGRLDRADRQLQFRLTNLDAGDHSISGQFEDFRGHGHFLEPTTVRVDRTLHAAITMTTLQ